MHWSRNGTYRHPNRLPVAPKVLRVSFHPLVSARGSIYILLLDPSAEVRERTREFARNVLLPDDAVGAGSPGLIGHQRV